MSLENEIRAKLKEEGVDFVSFADISHLSVEQNRRFPSAVFFGVALSREYLLKISKTPDYLQWMIRGNMVKQDEFHLKESNTDHLADWLADYLKSKGYSAFSQSEDNLYLNGCYNEKSKITLLPHKTIAGLSGLGWIGKHDLLITSEFGSAVSMCTVLTDAPLKTVLYSPTDSKCGECLICIDVCPNNAIKGKIWNKETSRDDLVDVFACNSCLKCLVHCPWTQNYVLNGTK